MTTLHLAICIKKTVIMISLYDSDFKTANLHLLCGHDGHGRHGHVRRHGHGDICRRGHGGHARAPVRPALLPPALLPPSSQPPGRPTRVNTPRGTGSKGPVQGLVRGLVRGPGLVRRPLPPALRPKNLPLEGRRRLTFLLRKGQYYNTVPMHTHIIIIISEISICLREGFHVVILQSYRPLPGGALPLLPRGGVH